MSESVSVKSYKNSFFQPAVKTILLTGFVAGTLDILAAFTAYSLIFSNVSPLRILQSIASGVFGQAAFAGGAQTAFFGLLFHYIIAFSWTVFFFLVFPYIPFLRKQKIIGGLIYGVFVWIMMNLVVLPLSNVNRQPFTLSGVLIGAVILMLFIGLPISLLVHKHYASKN